MRIVYPIFLSCRDCTTDIYWKTIFENLANGETPRGIYFKDSTLYSVTKKKEFNYNFSNKTASKITEDIYALFGTLYGIRSKGDMCHKKELFDEFQKVNSTRRSEDVWSKIKRKTIKDNLIQDYILQHKNMYNLSMEEVRKLYFYISVGCTFKLFSPTDIILKGGYIHTIDGIEYENGSVIINRKFEEPSIKKQSGKTIYLYTLWENYLKSLN